MTCHSLGIVFLQLYCTITQREWWSHYSTLANSRLGPSTTSCRTGHWLKDIPITTALLQPTVGSTTRWTLVLHTKWKIFKPLLHSSKWLLAVPKWEVWVEWTWLKSCGDDLSLTRDSIPPTLLHHHSERVMEPLFNSHKFKTGMEQHQLSYPTLTERDSNHYCTVATDCWQYHQVDTCTAQ